jgi:hypothetical protein
MKTRLIVVALFAAGVVAVAAHANGGSAISTAAAMPLESHVISGADRTHKRSGSPWATDYWKIALRSSARLAVDFGSTNGFEVNVCVLSPSVSDYTEEKAQCLGGAVTREKTELVFVAPTAGTYTVRFSDYPCACSDSMTYEFIARAQSQTRISITAPGHVRSGSRLTVRGVLFGGDGGKIAIKVTGPSNSRKVVAVGAGGRFASIFRLSKRGRYVLRATFYGDPSHLQSTRTIRISVT